MSAILESVPVGAPPGPLREFWLSFSANRGAVIGMGTVLFLLLLALFAPWIAPHSPDLTDSTAFLRPPAWQQGGSLQFLLGTLAYHEPFASTQLIGYCIVWTALIVFAVDGFLGHRAALAAGANRV